VPGVENYQRHPGNKLEAFLAARRWLNVGDGLWERGQSRLYVDAVGVFLFRQVNGAWTRTHGLAHNLIFPHKPEIIFRDLSTLDLLTGEWNGMGSFIS
jgi:hypothetical protein